MEKLFVKYEEALALKELGFDEPCFTWHWDDIGLYNGLEYGNHNKREHVVSAPLYQQAFRFFREKYNISYSIDWMSRSLESYNGYYVHFRGINGNKINQENFIVLNDELPPKGYGVYKTYEEAELACLIKLIEIVKNK
jgi:hypothetical protein